jgi:hypothetical protein
MGRFFYELEKAPRPIIKSERAMEMPSDFGQGTVAQDSRSQLTPLLYLDICRGACSPHPWNWLQSLLDGRGDDPAAGKLSITKAIV